MNANDILGTARKVLGIAAVVAAGIVLAKVLGMRGGVAGSVTEWTCVAIACALAGR
jgi:hypothetical protein